MSMKTKPLAQGGGTLKRNLGLWAIVGLGLGYMTPTVVFDTFGMVGRDTANAVPAAYLVALVVMVFTAISYGKIASAIPSAGSAYTYVRESIHPNLGFMVGWTSLIDYVLLPMVNCLIIRSYLEALFPDIPGWIWVVIYCVLVTAIIYLTMRGTSNANMVLLVFSIIVMAVFVVMVIAQLAQGHGAGTVASVAPFLHDGVTMGAVLMGATIVCFSFIGFDAVTMYAEEAKDPKIMPRAILLTVILGGAIFLVAAYFTQLRFPDWNEFAPGGDMQYVEDSTLPIIGHLVGGDVLRAVLTAAGFCATLASGLASHASVSRMLLVMGRNNVLPKKVFGYINPRTHTPTFNIVLDVQHRPRRRDLPARDPVHAGAHRGLDQLRRAHRVHLRERVGDRLVRGPQGAAQDSRRHLPLHRDARDRHAAHRPALGQPAPGRPHRRHGLGGHRTALPAGADARVPSQGRLLRRERGGHRVQQAARAGAAAPARRRPRRRTGSDRSALAPESRSAGPGERDRRFGVGADPAQITPCASIAFATRSKPAMLAPAT